MVEQAIKKPSPSLPQLPPEDVKWSSVSLSEVLDKNVRLEASVYNIKGKHAREILSRCKWQIVNLWSEEGLIEYAAYPTRFKRIHVEKNGVGFFMPYQFNELLPKPSKYISPETTDVDTLKVKTNQILLTRSGTIGYCTLVSRTLEGKVFSDDVIRVDLKDESDAGYLYAFLKTEIGRTLIQTNNYGAVVRHIEPEHLNHVPIPNPTPIIKSTINNLIRDSFRLRDESNELIQQAEKLLIAELRLPPIDELKVKYFANPDECKAYPIKLSELSGRFDGSYHSPIAKAILIHLRKNSAELVELKTLCKGVVKVGMFKRTYVEEGFGIPFLSGREILKLAPRPEKFLSYQKHKKLIEGSLKIEEDTILISARGTIGNVVITPKPKYRTKV